MTKKNKIGLSVAGAAAATIGGTALYVCFHTPNLVTNPSYRTFYRADGIPKKVFDKPWKANWQSFKQLVLHGEVCPSYSVDGDKFLTGHSNKSLIRSINPFK